MEQVPDMGSGTKDSRVNVQVKVGETGGVTGTLSDDNERRATEIGPVLEEILRTHWEHWGLND